MQTRRWLNPSQPQTLQIAVMLFYISAVFNVLLGSTNTPYLLNLLIAVGFGFGGYGIANDRRWGYQVGVAAAGAQLFFEVVLPLAFEPSIILNPGFLLIAIFPVALFALLLHPMSRDYQRIWFE